MLATLKYDPEIVNDNVSSKLLQLLLQQLIVACKITLVELNFSSVAGFMVVTNEILKLQFKI
jgi:hypothetical protein